jgi:hypothetical protein
MNTLGNSIAMRLGGADNLRCRMQGHDWIPQTGYDGSRVQHYAVCSRCGGLNVPPRRAAQQGRRSQPAPDYPARHQRRR